MAVEPGPGDQADCRDKYCRDNQPEADPDPLGQVLPGHGMIPTANAASRMN